MKNYVHSVQIKKKEYYLRKLHIKLKKEIKERKNTKENSSRSLKEIPCIFEVEKIF